MVLSDSFHLRKIAFAGLPEISDPSSKNKTYFQLAGRILLIFLFLGLSFKRDTWSWARIAISTVGFLACVMVAVGFKAKYSAMFLLALLSVFNVLINNWWSVNEAHPHRDFLKYSLSFCRDWLTVDTTSSKRCQLSEGSCYLSIWALVDSVSMKRKRFTRNDGIMERGCLRRSAFILNQWR
jgi:uncharacterized membrane protein YphA (DoxX/SURF4 family)